MEIIRLLIRIKPNVQLKLNQKIICVLFINKILTFKLTLTKAN